MKAKYINKLMNKYAICPNCGSITIEFENNKLKSGVMITDDMFKRVCKCGFNKTIIKK